ncbi:hypothetical protein MASR2M44_14130 [Bacteroidota bacterium]
MFHGKNILLFIPNGRGNYGTAIEAKLIEKGAKVVVFDERPSQSTLSKIGNRLLGSNLEFLNIKYFKEILNSFDGSVFFDFILVIRGEVFTSSICELFRRRFPEARFILYLWDSLKNNDKSSLFNYFDSVLSFDRLDCINKSIKFRPLFFLDYYDYAMTSCPKDIDVLFVGTIHSDRYCFINNFKKVFDKANYSTFFYLYAQSRLIFYKLWFQNPCMRSAKVSEINYSVIPAKEVAKLMLRSKVTLDLQHPSQSGLTMRTFEAVGARTKIITTNKEIRNYDFFNSDNIYILENGDFNCPSEFILSPSTELDSEVYKKYSLEGWLTEIFLN